MEEIVLNAVNSLAADGVLGAIIAYLLYERKTNNDKLYEVIQKSTEATTKFTTIMETFLSVGGHHE